MKRHKQEKETTKTVALDKAIERLLKNPNVRKGYLERRAAIEAARLVKAMRLNAKLTQAELAKLIDTQQPNIVALETCTGARGPTVEMLKRVASACRARLVIGFIEAPVEELAPVLDLRKTFLTLLRKGPRTKPETAEADEVVGSIKWMSAI